MPKAKKVGWIIKVVEYDGWVLARIRGDHCQYKHPTKPGVVTIPRHPSDTMSVDTQKSILRQAHISEEEAARWKL